MPYLYSQPASLLDYLPASGLLLVDDAAEMMAALADLEGQAEQVARDLTDAGDLPAGVLRALLRDGDVARAARDRSPCSLGHRTLDGWAAAVDTPLATRFGGPRFGGQVRTWWPRWNAAARRRHGGAGQPAGAAPGRSLREAGHAIAPVEDVVTPPPPGLTVVQGVMDEGWQLPGKLWFLTDAELFGWGKPKPRRPQRTRPWRLRSSSPTSSRATYVVHIEHGIGRFQGLIKMTAGRRRARVPAGRVRPGRPALRARPSGRPAGALRRARAKASPSLHRLGTAEWEQVKAARRGRPSPRSPTTCWSSTPRARWCRATPSAPTPLAARSWRPVSPTSRPRISSSPSRRSSTTWSRPRPMDRLICGDVGYGKTEVALRAAFKAVMDGKQVAVLVPTTVLAQQHYTTFSRRLAAFPVTRGDALALPDLGPAAKSHRERAGQGQRRHGDRHAPAAAARTCTFKDLGLLIVDEEQRFGVAHKERIKQLRTEVDVLTLTATPIPRTLHMSLTGRARPEHHRDAARGAPADQDLRRRVRRDAGAPGDPARAGSRRAGLLRPQPRPGHRADRGARAARSCPRRASPSATARCPRRSSRR